MVKLKINGQERNWDGDPDLPLLWFLRDEAGLTGTKYGCGQALCGTCTVIVDKQAVRACITSVSDVAGREVTTIEGLHPTGDHAVQKAWRQLNVPQCGYCQAGQIMQAAALLIVWQTVLDLNRESIRAIRRIVPTALTLIVVLNVVVAGFGVLLANAAGLSQLDGYLATSPGGIYAVLGTTLGSESNVAFVMTSQVVRVVLMLFAAPFVAKLFLRFTPRSLEVKQAFAGAVA